MGFYEGDYHLNEEEWYELLALEYMATHYNNALTKEDIQRYYYLQNKKDNYEIF